MKCDKCEHSWVNVEESGKLDTPPLSVEFFCTYSNKEDPRHWKKIDPKKVKCEHAAK